MSWVLCFPIIQNDAGACTLSKLLIYFFINYTRVVKWLGATKIRPLAVDHKGMKESLIRDLRHFASAQGRSIMNPGSSVEVYSQYGRFNRFN